MIQTQTKTPTPPTPTTMTTFEELKIGQLVIIDQWCGQIIDKATSGIFARCSIICIALPMV